MGKITKNTMLRALADVLTKKMQDKDPGQNRTSEADKLKEKTGEWYYIPLSAHVFCELLIASAERFDQIHYRRPGTFLEVGCGYAYFTDLAHRLGLKSTGIEKKPEYVEAAKKLHCGPWGGGPQIIEADALTFEDYDKFDLVYFYMPFSDPKLQNKLVKLIASKAKGLVIGSNYGTGKPFTDDSGDYFSGTFMWSAKLRQRVG